MIGTVIREYRILSEIGEGGMGKVYLAEHSILGKFAVKALAPQLIKNQQFRERFITEAKAQFALKHDNIVQLQTVMEEGDHLLLVMEYIDGESLEHLIHRRGAIPEKEALPIFKNALKGLDYAHRRGVIHRDIKPSNILLTKDGLAKIMDFGIAIMIGGKRMTKTAATIGTPQYMSPEQIKRPKEVDHRTDVYSMGIVLYEMLTGKVPFDADTDYEIYEKHIHEPPKDIRLIVKNISPVLADIVMKALEKNPDDRFAGCGQFLGYIKAYQEGKHIAVSSEKECKMKDRKGGRNTVLLSMSTSIGVVLLIIFIGFAVYVREKYYSDTTQPEFRPPVTTTIPIRPTPDIEDRQKDKSSDETRNEGQKEVLKSAVKSDDSRVVKREGGVYKEPADNLGREGLVNSFILKKGDIVSLKEVKGEWYLIKFDIYGWCQKFLFDSKPNPGSTDGNADGNISQFTVKPGMGIIVYTQPDINALLVKNFTLKKGDIVSVEKTEGEWYYIKFEVCGWAKKALFE